VDIGQVLSVFDKFGVSLGMLFVIGFAVRKMLLWGAPRADRVVNAHVELVETLKEQVERSNDILHTQSTTLNAVAEAQGRHGAVLDEMHKLSKEWAFALMNKSGSHADTERK
jgi:hypothetical protein